jgi:hypothetical protein
MMSKNLSGKNRRADFWARASIGSEADLTQAFFESNP